MKKRIITLVMSVAILLGAVPAFAAENEPYVPLRATFEGMGYKVDWYAETPNDCFVRIGEHTLMFVNNSNAVVADEGLFHTAQNTYSKDGCTYISRDAIELVKNIHLYHSAIRDCETMEADELLPLHSLNAGEEKVLVCTWHRYPSSYPDGAEITLKWGEVWVTVADEVLAKGAQGSGDDFILRMEQLIGLPPQKGYTHFTLMWVSPEDLFRPAMDPSITTDQAALSFPEGTEDSYKDWFAGQQRYSYSPYRYPWTGLGYTYDWADNGTDYGFSEYVIRPGSTVTVEKTYSNEAFRALLQQQAAKP